MKALLDQLAGFVSYRRRLIGALFAAAAVLLIAENTQKPLPTVEVAVVTTDVAAGQVLTSANVSLVRVPLGSAPASMQPDAAIGQVAAIPLVKGTPLQAGMVVAGSSIPAGRAIVPVPLSNRQLAPLLTPDTRVALVMSTGEEPHVITHDARVTALPTTQQAESALALSSATDHAVVLLEVSAKEAAILSVTGQNSQLGIYLTGEQ